jgi:hypothetical protein
MLLVDPRLGLVLVHSRKNGFELRVRKIIGWRVADQDAAQFLTGFSVRYPPRIANRKKLLSRCWLILRASPPSCHVERKTLSSATVRSFR